jgi:hypothetical protein
VPCFSSHSLRCWYSAVISFLDRSARSIGSAYAPLTSRILGRNASNESRSSGVRRS